MTKEAKIKWAITWIVLTPLILVSWFMAMLRLPFTLTKKLVDKVRKR